MTEDLLIGIPAPKHPIGSVVLALINHRPRYARIQQAHLSANFVLTESGLSADGLPRWEYSVRILNRSGTEDEADLIVIAEKTILFGVDEK